MERRTEMKHRLTALVISLVMLLTLMAGCGTQDSAESAGSPAEETSVQAASTAPAPEESAAPASAETRFCGETCQSAASGRW